MYNKNKMQHRHIWQRLGYYAIMLVQVFMASVGIWLLSLRDWKYASISLSAVAFGFLPVVINRFSLRIKLPVTVTLLYVLFIFFSYFLGEVFGLYGEVELWDMTLHFSSGILLVAFGYWWMHELKVHYKLRNPVWLALLFAFFLSVTGAALWEAVEFLSDQWFGTYSQDGGLVDTMYDIVANMLASALTVLVIGLCMKRRPKSLLQKLLRKPASL